MDDGDAFLARRFDIHAERLLGVALRMLGSRREATEALGEARSAGLGGFDGWLTTAVARVCVERLRARRGGCVRGADARDGDVRERVAVVDGATLALFVVLESLAPDERLAFVLHELFALPVPDVARLTGRTTPEAAGLVHAARRRVRGARDGSEGGAAG